MFPWQLAQINLIYISTYIFYLISVCVYFISSNENPFYDCSCSSVGCNNPECVFLLFTVVECLLSVFSGPQLCSWLTLSNRSIPKVPTCFFGCFYHNRARGDVDALPVGGSFFLSMIQLHTLSLSPLYFYHLSFLQFLKCVYLNQENLEEVHCVSMHNTSACNNNSRQYNMVSSSCMEESID